MIFCLHPKQSERDIYNLWEDGAPHKHKKGGKRRFWRPKNHQRMTRETDLDLTTLIKTDENKNIHSFSLLLSFARALDTEREREKKERERERRAELFSHHHHRRAFI